MSRITHHSREDFILVGIPLYVALGDNRLEYEHFNTLDFIDVGDVTLVGFTLVIDAAPEEVGATIEDVKKVLPGDIQVYKVHITTAVQTWTPETER
jgi:hypothetical protein